MSCFFGSFWKWARVRFLILSTRLEVIKLANKVDTAVEKLAAELILQMPGLELVDVEYVKERDWYLRIFIDKEGGVDLDDCRDFSEKIGALLDHESLLRDPYVLEVSSPGLDRALKKPRDFIRERGKTVDVSLYAPIDGKKSVTGVLEGCAGNFLALEGHEPIPMDKVSLVRLHIDF